MRPDHRASRRGSRHVLTGLATAGLTLALLTVASTASASVGRAAAASRRPLAGKVIGIDPGHNGLNYTDPAFLNHKIWNGREWEGCDTTGTQTAGGYGGPVQLERRDVPARGAHEGRGAGGAVAAVEPGPDADRGDVLEGQGSTEVGGGTDD